MATFVNDLRLKEIATGDEAGTWGTSTNTNLELIGEAMGVGAEAVANASTHTITMADGAADQFRSTFLRLTGGGQACTVTLAPNTLSHTWIMRNETAAALTLTQGSGANVAIAAGQTKIVATDGLGSGAVVYEMDDLELAGNLAVGGTLAVTGAFTNGSTLVSTGKITADAGIDIDNINIDGTTIALSSGDLTLDVAGTISLDADDAGEIRLKDGGTQYGVLKIDSNRLKIQSIISDADMLFAGNDGGSEITALTLDMSAAGAATFNASVNAGAGLRISTDGSNNGVITTLGQDKDMFFSGDDGGSGINALVLDMSAAGAATFNNSVTATSLIASNGILELDDNGSHNGVINVPASLFVNIDSDNSNTGELFAIAKDRTSTSGGTELFRVQENGNVGIGASSLSTKLEVADSNAGFATIRIRRTDVSNSDVDLSTGGGATGKDFTISVNQAVRMRIDASGNLIVGTTTAGTKTGDGVIAFGATGGVMSNFSSSVANNGTLDIAINTAGGGYQGFLSVANTVAANAAVRTQSTFSVFGRSTDSSIQQIATDTGTSAATFTVTTPSNGVIRVTNTSGSACSISMHFFGGASL